MGRGYPPSRRDATGSRRGGVGSHRMDARSNTGVLRTARAAGKSFALWVAHISDQWFRRDPPGSTGHDFLAQVGTLRGVKIDRDAQVSRFSRRLVIYEAPDVAQHLEEIAATVGTSTASVVRSAIRSWLRQVDPPQRAR